jgi:glycosidase
LDGTLAAEQVLFPPGAQSVIFLNNHDTTRVMSEVKSSAARAKIAATLLLTLPGTPMVYYGEEIGMAGLKGQDDKPVREPMDWYAAETGQGMTTWYRPDDRSNKPRDGVSVEEEQGSADSVLAHYAALIALRNANPALQTGAWERVAVDGSNTVYAYLRSDSNATFLVVLNFGSTAASVSLDLGATSLPDQRYAATDALSKQTLTIPGANFNLGLDPTSGYVFQLTPK